MMRRLLGLASFKPLECVGTPEEVTAAMWRLHVDGRTIAGAADALFVAEVLPGLTDPEALSAEVMTPVTADAMSPHWRERLDAYLTAS